MTNAKQLSVAEFPTYEEYKDSGVEWLGEVPKGWGLQPGFVVVKENKKSNKGMIENTVLSLSYGNIIVRPEEKLTGLVPDSFETYQIVETNDIIVRCTDLQNDKVSLRTGLARQRGIITSAYLNLGVKEDFDAKYVHYYLHSVDTSKVIYQLGSGLRQNLSYQDFKRFPFFDFSKHQQTLIAQFLDQKTALIDQAIAIKEQQIKLLNERKQIIIQQAVTQGLNPNAPMKDSGVDWIGQIPEHWEVSLGFTVYKEVRDSNKGLIENKVLSLSYGQIIIRPESKMFGLMPESFETYQIVQPDDIIIRCTDLQNDKTSLRTGIVKNKGIITSAYLNIRAKEKLLPSYLHYFFHVLDITKAIYKFGSGLRQNLSFNDFRRMNIATPPLEEQKKIVAFIKNSSNRATEIIALHNQQIQALKEYKTTLINSAVTGKIKITKAMLTEVKEVGYAE